MAHYRINYTAYPTSERATQCSREHASSSFFLSMLSIWLILPSIVWYIYGLICLMTKADFLNFIFSLINILGISWLPLYNYALSNKRNQLACQEIVLCENNKNVDSKIVTSHINQMRSDYIINRNETIKYYFFLFIPAFITTTFTIWLIESIYLVSHHDGDLSIFFLVMSILVLIGCLLFYLFVYTKLFSTLRSMRFKIKTPTSTIKVKAPMVNDINNLEQNLKVLKQLQDDGLITEADYNEKKKQLLNL